MTSALLLLHPQAHRHKKLPQLIDHLRQAFKLQITESRYPGHLVDYCRTTLPHFQGLVLSGGGDGTLHEIVNAWVQVGSPPGIAFTPLPLGSANDFLYSLRPDLKTLTPFLKHPLQTAYHADLGRVSYQTPQGHQTRVFCVGATTGFSALVTQRRSTLARRIRGKLSYLFALALSLSSWKNTSCIIGGPDLLLEHPIFFNANVANVRYYGGGMISAPQAHPFSGKLHLVSMNLTLGEVLWALPENFKGRFERIRHVYPVQTERPLLISTGRPCLVQADGELLGHTPMITECLPAKLPLMLPGQLSET